MGKFLSFCLHTKQLVFHVEAYLFHLMKQDKITPSLLCIAEGIFEYDQDVFNSPFNKTIAIHNR